MQRSRTWAMLAATVVILGVMLPGVVATASITPHPPSDVATPLVRTTDVLPGLDHAVLDGPTAPATRLTVDIGLQTPDQSREANLLSALYNPSSADYHQFLSPSQFDQQFRVPAATVAATESWLRSGGLNVSYKSGTGNLISVQGTVAQLGALLHTTFGDYSVGGISFIANQLAPMVPAALPINDVVGLNTLQRMWTQPELRQFQTLSAPSTPAAAPTNYVGTLVPQDLWDVYDAPSSDEGQGETAGMFGFGYVNGIVPTLRIYEQRLGLPTVPVRTVSENQVTNPPVPSDNDVLGDLEWSNDTQAISGMAPKLSQLDMYFASTGYDADVSIMFSDWANDPKGPEQMDASFGECESDPTSRFNLPSPPLSFGVEYGAQGQLLEDPSLEQAVLEGRTLFASAGDNGGSCPAVILPVLGDGIAIIPQPLPFDQNYPCASAFAVCVGGTVVTTTGTTNPAASGGKPTDFAAQPTRVSEQAWLYGGGGSAANVPRPAYQDGVGAIDKPCVEPSEPNGTVIALGTTCRGAPDVAALSGSGLPDGILFGNNAFLTNTDMMPTGVVGTSVSSPLVVGQWARIQAAAPPDSKGTFGGLGFANETFYAVGKGQLGQAGRDFYDITTNEVPVGNFYELAGKGWDYTSGWGAIDVANFIRDVDHNAALKPTHPANNADYTPYFPQTVCAATMTSPVGNAYDSTLSLTSNVNDVGLDMTAASLVPSADGQDLVATISGPGLSTDPPIDAQGGINFYVTWTFNGATYFAGAEVDPPEQLPATPALKAMPLPLSLPTGTVVFGDGLLNSDTPTFAHKDVGSFADHTMTVDVPLANVGSPGPGALLLYPFAFDTLPFGIFVPLASDEAVADNPAGQALELGRSC
jgi:subtilase family serine protease